MIPLLAAGTPWSRTQAYDSIGDSTAWLHCPETVLDLLLPSKFAMCLGCS